MSTEPTVSHEESLSNRKKRRAWARYSASRACRVREELSAPELGQPAIIQNISSNGASLLSPRPLPPAGTAVLIALEQLKPPLCLRAKIVHAVRRTDGTWFIGCEFHERLGEEELDAILQG